MNEEVGFRSNIDSRRDGVGGLRDINKISKNVQDIAL
jgi:hypothetical protein